MFLALSLLVLFVSAGLWIQHYEKSQFRQEWWASCTRNNRQIMSNNFVLVINLYFVISY